MEIGEVEGENNNHHISANEILPCLNTSTSVATTIRPIFLANPESGIYVSCCQIL